MELLVNSLEPTVRSTRHFNITCAYISGLSHRNISTLWSCLVPVVCEYIKGLVSMAQFFIVPPRRFYNGFCTPCARDVSRFIGLCVCCVCRKLSSKRVNHYWWYKRKISQYFYSTSRCFKVCLLGLRARKTSESDRSNVYFIYAGTYKEQVYINRPNVTLIGESRQTTRFSSNTVHITNNLPASQAGSNDLSGTVRVSSLATGGTQSITFQPVTQSQAIALSVQAGMFGAYAIALKGYQDTLLANVGTQFYGRSYINGAVDFIFGQRASIWITRSEIETLGDGYITASGRLENDANWYVIDRTKVYSNGTGSVYLGRPWRNYARVVFQNSELGANVLPAGWSIWSTTDNRTNMTDFAEFKNTGPGAWYDQRASFSHQLAAPIGIETVLNSTSWIDPKFLT
ncbi:carbohydrate esterase family 8 protein [Rhizoctonia solani AG-1 IA]|uniref:Pectinesterase n=1 Tax=Thanatephorus cucumeris (strain AG1-IA) TaxID=983506 RepID=L8WPH0_THACA|nr:carbohydrate esterase family 8 protein [Rhizoctonia solani AG-1 IA]